MTAAAIFVLFGAFVGYSYADDNVPDFFSDPLGALTSTFQNLTGQQRDAGDPTWATDPSTLNNWYNGDQGLATDQQLQSTKNTGRVWTDKTVSSGDVTLTNNENNQTIEVYNDNSNTALVGLSALSSAATIQTTDTEVQPLDIVLVLDASPSMATDMTGYEYNPTYDIDQNSTYYVRLDDGSYEEISYSNGSWSSKSLQNVTPKQSDGGDGIQFYTRSEIEGYTRLDAMKEAASQFVDEMVQTNAGISDPYSKHHVSIVKFGGDVNTETGNGTYQTGYGSSENYTQIMVDMGEVNESNAASIKNSINDITVSGDSIGSDMSVGLDRAEAALGSSRGNAKKIVIVLSSNYQPQDDEGFSTVDDAVAEANKIKTQGVDIYSIGIFNLANPDQVNSPANKYMHAISSNYLNPTSQTNNAGGIQLGNRNTGNYYFGASDSAELNDVFNEIRQTLTSNAESPIAEIAQERPGSLTFTDQLGDFMEVKNFKSIVYAGQKFDFTGEPTTSEDELTTTYTFTGSVGSNGVYDGGDLSDISITVKHSTDEQTGDLVTVTVPANLIPLRNYSVTEGVDGKVSATYDNAYPLRVFYTVGVKDEVLKSLDNPSDELKAYIKEQTGDENSTEIPFYTNDFERGSKAGDTTATFTPATSNSFYYFTEPTPIYSDPECQTQFDSDTFDPNAYYYYQRTWYEGNEKKTEIVKVKGNDDLLSADHTQRDEITHRWSIKEGTPRLNRADEFAEAKDPNSTGTASDVITPSWTIDGATSTVVAALGNNGKVTHTVPGKLDISKTVNWGNGTPDADKEFTFTVDLDGETVVPGDFTYTIYDGEGTDKPVEGGTATIQDGGTIKLKDGQHVVIEDLPAGMDYTVTETVPAGFTTNHDGNAVNGTIQSKQTANVDFTNTYNLHEVTLDGNDELPVTKTIEGRDWTDGDSFGFTLAPDTTDKETSDALAADAIKFDDIAATVDSTLKVDVEASDSQDDTNASRCDFFGNITFTKPGTYKFTVTENIPDTATNPNVDDGAKQYSAANDAEKATEGWQLNGISYTVASQTVTVVVTDIGDGTMAAAVDGTTPSFTNTYKVSGKLENITGKKNLTGRDFKQGDSFTFNVTGSATTLDGGEFTGTVPMPSGVTGSSVTINPSSGGSADVVFGTINFTQEGIYTYTFKEQAPAGATEDNAWTANGITYDVADKTIEVRVEDTEHDGTFTVTVTTSDDQNITGALTWNNSYKAASNTGVIGGSKTLQDREWLSGESVSFQLEPNDTKTQTAVRNNKIQGFTVDGDAIQPLTESVSKNGDFSFDALTFTEVDEYQFKITEVMPDGANEDNNWTVNGVKYDHHTAIVNVSVTDPGTGQLQVTVTPSTAEEQGTAFTNDYTPTPADYTFSFGGTKTVNVESGSYTLDNGAFSFILKPVGNAPMPNELSDGASWVNSEDHSAGIKVSNGDASNNSASFSFGGTITFTKPDTYRYTVKEDSSKSVPGIKFDNTEYTIEIEVTEDQATGTLTVGEPTVVGPMGTQTTGSSLVFANTFTAGQTSISIPGTKNLNGRSFAPAPGDEFTFNVSMVASDGGSAAIPDGLDGQSGVSAIAANSDGTGYTYTYTINPTGDGTGSSDSELFNFGNIAFTQAGTYTFTIAEKNSGSTVQGMSYDGMQHTVEVRVEQNNDATLDAHITKIDDADYTDGSRVEFNNTYAATGTDSIAVVKQLGRDWTDDDSFTFTLAAYDDDTKAAVKAGAIVLPGVENPIDGDESVSIDVTNTDVSGADHTKSFENITFKKAGTYKFVVQEQAPKDAENNGYQGVTYDTAKRIVTIVVSHNYQGGFEFSEPTVTTEDGATSSLTFNNAYAAAPDTVSDITVTKTLTGRPWTDADKFSFTLAADSETDGGATADAITDGSIVLPGGGTTATVTVPEEGAETPKDQDDTATFGGITFKTAGIYHFVLTEDAHNRPNVSHDNSTKHLTVTVTDNGKGSLVAMSEWATGENPAFTNTYTADAATVDLQVQKTLPGATWGNGSYTGRAWGDDESFGFTVELTNATDGGTKADVVMPDDKTATVSKPDSGNVGTGAFQNIKFKAEGTYTFTIKETSHTVGDTALTGDQFTSAQNGMTYDDHTATVTVKVTDNPATGDLVPEVSYNNDGASASDATLMDIAAFTNIYEATPATQVLTVNKTLQNRSWDGVSFGFTLTLDDAKSHLDVVNVNASTVVDMPSNSTTLTVDSNSDSSAAVEGTKTDSFDPITFKAPGTYVFTVEETVPDGAENNKYQGITYDATPRTVTITVADNGNGQLNVTNVTGAANGVVSFTNTYGATGVLNGAEFPVTKELTGRPWTDTDDFTFALTAVSATDVYDDPIETVPMPTTKSTISTATPGDFAFVQDSETEKTGNFGSITYTQAGTYIYEVRETSQGGNGVTPDTSVYRVSVEVEDPGTGSLDVKEPVITKQVGEDAFESVSSIHFTNTYTASDTTATVNVQKTITGRGWLDDDSFEFALERVIPDAPMPAGATGDTVTKTLEPNEGDANPATGAFDPITFTKADLNGAMSKTFEYEVTETSEDGKGVTCDNHTAKVSITVTDNGQGALSAQVVYDNDTEGAADADKTNTSRAAFTNTYEAADAEVTLDVEKVVTGASAPENFEFGIALDANKQGPVDGVTGLDGNTATVDKAQLQLQQGFEEASHMASFSPLTFTEPGTYTFDITEKNGDYGNGWTYDNDNPNTVEVTVEDNEQGALKVTSVRYNDEDGVDATEDTASTFTNQYTAGKLVVNNLQVTKQVVGNETDEDFTFELTLTTNNAANVTGLDENNTVTATADEHFAATTNEAAEQTVTFPQLTFTEPGDYTFTVHETNTAPAGTSWTYGADNSNDPTITVKVRDNGTGNLVANGSDRENESGIEGNNPIIVNRYEATGAATIAVQKDIANRDWLTDDPVTEEYEGDSFDFELTATDDTQTAIDNGDVVMPTGDGTKANITSDTANHTVQFGQITFKVPGIYTFDVTEKGENHDGLTYDTAPKTVTIVVDDLGNGQLSAQIQDGVVTITNTYGASGTTNLPDGSIDLTKVLDGRAWNENDEFTFTIAADHATAPDGTTPIAGENIPLPAEKSVTVGYDDIATGQDGQPAVNEDGNNYADFTFGAITFSQPGTYVYTVTESDTGNPGMTEAQPATVTITVTDNHHGGYTAAVTSVTGNPLTNVYGTQLDYNTAGGLTIVKNLTNQDITEGEFTFTVTPDDADSAALIGMTDGWTAGKGKTYSTHAGDRQIDDNGNAVASVSIPVFDNAAFTHEHNGDTYGFTISETGAPAGNGYSNDTTVYHVSVAIADDAQGTLTATTKVEVQTADANHPHDNATYTYTNTNEGETGPAQVVFNNDYDATGTLGAGGTASIAASKVLTNGQLAGSDFGFTVYDANDDEVTTGTNAADGAIAFDPVSYTTDQIMWDILNNVAEDAGKVDGKDTYTYQYTVSEDTDPTTGAPLDPSGNPVEGVTVNHGSFTITVTVTDNGDGTLSTAVTYPAGTEQLTFQNTYGTVAGASVSLNVGGTKKLVVNSTGDTVPTLASIAGQYTFHIQGSVVEGEDGNVPLPENTTATNDAAGNVNFGDIDFSIESVWGTPATGDTSEGDAASAEDGVATSDDVSLYTAQRTKRLQYLVSEEGSQPGITNGVAQVFFVTVTDNGDGTVSVSCTDGNSAHELTPGDQFTITNEYNVTPTTSTVTDPNATGSVTINKELDGRALNEGEFTFAMTGVSAPDEVDPSFGVLTATNAADGSVSFPALTFTQAGTYEYRITEVNNQLGGVTYDDAVYLARAQVTDNGDGTLSVAWTVTDAEGTPVDAITFKNSYEIVQPGSIVFGAVKTLDGRDLTEGEFTFELRDEDGNVLQTATNAADGSVVFADPIAYGEVGNATHTYTIVEQLPEDDDPTKPGVQKDNVTYDETVYTATVTVTDNGDGTTTASVDYGTGNELPVFENTYVEPPALPGTGGTTTEGTPQTSDPTNPVLPGALAASGVALVIAGAVRVLRRRNG